MDHSGIGRRRLLIGGAALGAAGMTAAAPAAMSARRGGLIDVHHHIRPPNAPPIMMKLMPDWTEAGAVAGMDRAGVATGIAWPGPIHGNDIQANRRLARSWNEYGAQLGQDHPGRFGLFASLPMLDVAGCLAEIDYAVDHLHADGFGITTSYGNAWLGDQDFWPIYEKLNSLNAVVFVHPADASCCGPASMSYMRPGIDGSWIEWPMNTARTILSLMASGTLGKYPNIRFIFCHGGGVMPLLVNRIAAFSAWKHVGPAGLKAMFPDGIENEFRQLHFECAQACSHTNMDALRSLVPDSRILFGSDFPFFPLSHAATQFADLRLPAAAAQAIGRGNAMTLLPRWA